MKLKRIPVLVVWLCLAVAVPAHAAVVGWGLNGHGEVGPGYKSGPQDPVASLLPAGVKQVVSAGLTSYALLDDGSLLAWGAGSYGQLGNGARTTSFTPVAVKGLAGVTQIAAAGAHAVALLSDGTVATWGGNAHGTLGNGTSGGGHGEVKYSSTVPIHLGLTGIVAVAAGGADVAALRQDGTVLVWGENKSGQLGDGTKVEKDVPTQVPGLFDVKQIAFGAQASHGGHLLALLADGTVRAAGENGDGQLGDGATTDSLVPVAVKDLGGVSAISADISHNLALLGDGTVMTWGGDAYGQLGIAGAPQLCGRPKGTKTPCATLPVPIPGLTASAVDAGLRHSLAISSGRVLAWGHNDYGQLGAGRLDSPVPVLVPGVVDALRIDAGEYHGFAIVAGGGPLPALSVTEGRGSLTVTWRWHDSSERWMVSWRRVTKPAGKWAPYVSLPGEARTHTVTGLASGKLVEVRVKNSAFGARTVTATPR